MTPERFQQIGELYHQALALKPDERAAFLDQACAGDDSLRHEVERLLASNEAAGSFLAAPAIAAAAELIAEDQADALIGRRLGRYRILSRIGAGGMGEVYLATDERLGRKVALKLLPAEFAASPDRLRRFEREAKAASATDHPNIVTIHEIGETDGIHFIADTSSPKSTLMAKRCAARSNAGLWRCLKPCISHGRSQARWPPRTMQAWFTATSNPKTSCCGPTAM